MVSAAAQKRASGATAAEEEAKVQSEKNDELATATAEHDRVNDPKSMFRTPGFSRLRTDWHGDDLIIVQRASLAVNTKIEDTFQDAFAILNDLYDIVRFPDVDDDGIVRRDAAGWPKWQRRESGEFLEDWSRLTRAGREDFLFRIATRMFNWEQLAADAWGEAMMSKAQWEEVFAINFDAPVKGTIEDRTSKGRIAAQDERYFSIYVTLFSKKAEAIVKTMNMLYNTLKMALV